MELPHEEIPELLRGEQTSLLNLEGLKPLVLSLSRNRLLCMTSSELASCRCEKLLLCAGVILDAKSRHNGAAC